MPLWRLSNSHSKDYSWIEIGVRMAEISWKPRWHTDRCHRWIFKIHTFSKTRSQNLSRVPRSTPFYAFWGRRSLKGRCLKIRARAINSPKHPSDQKRNTFFWVFALFLVSLHVFPSSKTPKNLKNTLKPLDSSLFTKNTRYCSYTQSSFPWFYTLDLGFRGVDVAFLAIIHTPNL